MTTDIAIMACAFVFAILIYLLANALRNGFTILNVSTFVVLATGGFPILARLVSPKTTISDYGAMFNEICAGLLFVICGFFYLVSPERTKQFLKSQQQSEQGRDRVEKLQPATYRIFGVVILLVGAGLLRSFLLKL